MKQYLAAVCIAVISCSAFAQTTVETQRRETTVRTADGGSVTTVETSTVVRDYVSYLYETYTSVNIPQAQINQLIALDLQILEARIRGDYDQVRVYVQNQVQIVGVPVIQRIHTHVHSHPVPSAFPVYAQPVWVNNVNIVDNDVRIDVDINRSQIQQAIKQNNVKVEQLNIDAGVQAVKSGKIDELRSSKPNRVDKKADRSDGKSADAGETPRAGETPSANQTPRSGETPTADQTPPTGETTGAGETPRAGQAPRADGTPTAGATPSGANPDPNAPPATASERAQERSQSPNQASTPASGATPSAGMTPSAFPGAVAPPANATQPTQERNQSPTQASTPAASSSSTPPASSPSPGETRPATSSSNREQGASNSSTKKTEDGSNLSKKATPRAVNSAATPVPNKDSDN